MSALDDILVSVTVHAVRVEMRCKECGNGVAGIERVPVDRVREAIEASDFEAAAKSHTLLCSAPHRPCNFDIVATDADVSAK